jgi:hypothetical protein
MACHGDATPRLIPAISRAERGLFFAFPASTRIARGLVASQVSQVSVDKSAHADTKINLVSAEKPG